MGAADDGKRFSSAGRCFYVLLRVLNKCSYEDKNIMDKGEGPGGGRATRSERARGAGG